jgi:hypothetical protein
VSVTAGAIVMQGNTHGLHFGSLRPEQRVSSCIVQFELRSLCLTSAARTDRYPKFLTALFNLWSSALLQTPLFKWPGILLHLLRQSLFVRPGRFAAMRFQSLRLPRLTGRASSSVPGFEKLNPWQYTYAESLPPAEVPGPLPLSTTYGFER